LPLLSGPACTAQLEGDGSAGAGTNGPESRATENPQLRRLTRSEYDNSVRDLLGTVQRPALNFAPELEDSSGIPSTPAPTSVDVQRYGTAALELSEERLAALLEQANCGEDPEDACAQSVWQALAPRAFRRPPTSEELERYGALYSAFRASDHTAREALALLIQALLQSPQFLYRADRLPIEDAALRGYAVASRLSYALWQTMPDAELFDAAASGALDTLPGIEEQARRLLGDARARRMIARFHEVWFERDKVDGAAKSPLLFPEFDDEVRTALGDELGELAAHVILELDGRLETLLTVPVAFVNVASAPWYGISGIGGRDLQRVEMPATERSGLLTTAGFLAAHANPNQSSPIKRGAFVRERLLCQQLPPPPPELFVAPPTPDPALPTRERFRRHAEDPGCSSCHQLIDPLGFTFEAYDAAGRYRTHEGSTPVDTSGQITGTLDANGPVSGVPELAARLAASYAVRRCVAQRWFRFTTGQLEGRDDPSLEQSYARFQESDFDIRELILGIVTSDAFLGSALRGKR
jgi:hypothetical protein